MAGQPLGKELPGGPGVAAVSFIEHYQFDGRPDTQWLRSNKIAYHCQTAVAKLFSEEGGRTASDRPPLLTAHRIFGAILLGLPQGRDPLAQMKHLHGLFKSRRAKDHSQYVPRTS